MVLRGTSDRNLLDDFCIRFTQIVEQHARYIIVSGYLAISSGRVRATEDIDLILQRMDIERFTRLHQDLISHGFECMQSDDPREIFSYLDENASVRYTLKDQALPEMEVKFAKDYLDDYQLKTRQKIPLTGLDVWFSSVDMNIAFKEEYLKSDKDLKDASHMRTVFADLVDETEIQNIKKLIRQLRLQ